MERRLYSQAKIMRDNSQREMNGHNGTNSGYSSIGVRRPKVNEMQQRIMEKFSSKLIEVSDTK